MSPPHSRGRSLSGHENVRPPQVEPAPLSPPVRAAGSPFARYGPDSRAMVEAGEENRRQSMGVFAIVAGLIFALVAVTVVAGVVALSWIAIRQTGIATELVGPAVDDDRHIRDDASAPPLEPQAPQPTGGRPRTGAGADPNAPPVPTGPVPGPVTVIVPSSMMFLSIEVSCPGGLRDRGSFRADGASSKRATVPNVPSDERCTVTFQGSEPARTWITGGETRTCTFNPVTCHLVR